MLRVLALIALVAATAAPITARAEDPKPATDPKAAKRALGAGDAFMKKGDQQTKRGKAAEAQASYERALAAYTKAHDLSQNPQVFFAIAAAEEKLGRNADAVRHYKRVAKEVTGKPQLVELANARVDELITTVGTFTAKVDPLGADIAIDGTSYGKAPLTDPVILAPGNYTLSITADGYQPLTARLDVEAGTETDRTYKLEPVTIVVQKPREAPRPVVPKKLEGPTRIPIWLGLFATVGLATTGTITGITAMKRHDTFEDTGVPLDERESARKSGLRLARTTDFLIGGAVVAGLFTTYYYVWVYRPKARRFRQKQEEERRRQPPPVVLAPWATGDGAGAVLTGTF